MGRWTRFFLGTPQRLLWTLVGLGTAACLIDPEAFRSALALSVGTIMAVLCPLIQPVLMIVIVLAGLRFILRGGKK